MKTIRLLAYGGRFYKDKEAVYRALDSIHRLRCIEVLIHGGATGADSFAGTWAYDRGVNVVSYPARWTRHGKAAGMIRNEQMLHEGKPTAAVQFPGGAGTRNMRTLLDKAGVPVWERT